MNKNVVCTIITGNYGHYALALHDSLLVHNNDINFAIFISEGDLNLDQKAEFKKRKNVSIFTPEDFTSNNLATKLQAKYALEYHDAYRWAMKPLVLNKLLESRFDHAIYVDSDIYFHSDYQFLFERLQQFNVLLSPHWRSSDPIADSSNFKLNFLDGIYNGGFVGASKNGIPALTYWAELCLYKCEANRNEGFYVDQRYLDILPTRFDKIGHIKHKGCNVANWNKVDCERILQKDGSMLINNQFPVVFIHYTNTMFRGVLKEDDALLLPYLQAYRDALLKYNATDVMKRFIEKGQHLKPRADVNSDKSNIKSGKSLLKKIVKKVKTLKD